MLAEQAFGSSRVPGTHGVVARRLFCCLKGLSVIMEQLPRASQGLQWEEFCNNAMNQGAEWLRGRLQELGRDELRSLAVAGSIRAKIGDRWLSVAQLRSALMEALAPTEQAQS